MKITKADLNTILSDKLQETLGNTYNDMKEAILVKESKYKGKHPKRINTVGSLKGKNSVMVILNDGTKHELDAKQTKGNMPKPGEDISKYISK